MINKGVLHTVATRFPRNNAITCQWGWGEWANTTMIAFTGVTRLNSCVRTHCFHLFDICRVEFIWGNITFLSYIDGSVQERCNSSALAMELRLSCNNPSKYSPQNTKSRLLYIQLLMTWCHREPMLQQISWIPHFSDFFSLGNGNITLFFTSIVVRRAGLLWSQQDFEWRWSVPLFKCLTVLEFSFILFDFVFINHIFQFYYELCTYCNILDIYLS